MLRNKLIVSALGLLLVGHAQADPEDEGSWSSEFDWPLIAIHTVLTPQGKVLNFGTDEDGVQGAHFIYDVWDPEKGTGSSSHTTLPNTLGVDSFCSAAVLMPETGNVLMSGGDSRPSTGSEKKGINDAPIFNTQTNALSRATDMASARWYPTSTVLANGDILLSGGRDGEGRDVLVPEVYSPFTNQWRSLFGVSSGGDYPRQWLAPNGLVFGYASDKAMYYLDPAGNGNRQELGDLDIDGDPYNGTAVMYQPGKILAVGGKGDSNNDTVIIDLNSGNPSVRSVSKPSESGRIWSDTIVLPNGHVMIVGGSKSDNKIDGVADNPEIWDPATEKWTKMKSSDTPRLYHSTAMLLKDGRILVAGGGAPGPLVNTNAEVYTPPYLYNSSGNLASRPTISSAPDEAPYSSDVSVSHPSSNAISRVTLVKTGAVTHSFNMEQRFLELDFDDTSTGVSVKMPSSANLAPPGYYLLHLIDNQGVPSKAHIIRLSSTAVLDTDPFPVGNADSATSTSGNTITIDVLANDVGSGKVLVTPSAWSMNGGSVSLTSNKISYKPKSGYNGQDKIWYTFTDRLGRTSWGEVTIAVSGNAASSNPFPTAYPDYGYATGSTITIDVLNNDGGNGLTLNAPNAWSLNGGQVKVVNNKISYTQKAGFNGQDKIWYTMKDVENRTAWSEVLIDVVGTVVSNPVPVGNADNHSVKTGVSTTINVLANDIGNGLVLNPLSSAYSLRGGSVSMSNNQLRYQSKSGYTGEDKVWYTFKDVEGRSSWGEVVINVTQ